MRVEVTPTALELFYRTAPLRDTHLHTAKTKTAPEDCSGAVVLPSKFRKSSSCDASRDQEVVCSSISLNGRRDWI